MPIADATFIRSQRQNSEFKNILQQLIQHPPEGLTVLWTITPEMAIIMMERNQSDEWHNRPQSRLGLSRYKRDMQENRWILTGDTIKFSEEGRLLDGQHRLQACIDANVSFVTLVAFGIPKAAFKKTDRSIPRTTGSIFAISDIPNFNAAAAVTSLLVKYNENSLATDPRGSMNDNEQVLEYYLENADQIQESIAIYRKFKAEGLLAPRWLAACYFICAAKNHHDANTFFEQFATGLGIVSPIEPAYVLRRALTANKTSRTKRSELELAAYVIKAWNAFRTGRRISLLKWLPDEEFPIPR